MAQSAFLCSLFAKVSSLSRSLFFVVVAFLVSFDFCVTSAFAKLDAGAELRLADFCNGTVSPVSCFLLELPMDENTRN